MLFETPGFGKSPIERQPVRATRPTSWWLCWLLARWQARGMREAHSDIMAGRDARGRRGVMDSVPRFEGLVLPIWAMAHTVLRM
jgi:hypothetical protein